MTTAVVVVLLMVATAFAAVEFFRWVIDRREAASRSLPPIVVPFLTSHDRDALDMANARRPQQAPERVVPVGPRQNGRADAPAPVNPVDAVVDDDTPSPMETVRFYRPSEEPVQLLPGRLEVLAGTTRHREIRFVRVPGKPLHLYVGRDAGPAPQYIGLDSPTVSRRHARFAYADGRWLVKNLSHTNPLIVNDDELADIDDERPLVDGDRLELGEVVLRFHAQ
jgi:hypothetical protein